MSTLKCLILVQIFALASWSADLCGTLYMPTTLSKDKSPYRITGDIYVPPASRLTIEAGVELVIVSKPTCKESMNQLDWSDSQFVSIQVDGAFYIKGNPKAPVLIHPESQEHGKVQWDGIRLNKQEPHSAAIQFLQITGANRALQIRNSKFIIENSVFEDNNIGIKLGEKGNVTIRNNLFYQSTSAGIYTEYAAPEVVANIFSENSNAAIWADSRKGLNISYNLFWESGDADCWHCAPEIGKRTAKNAKGDSIDSRNNIFANPVFVETADESKHKQVDIQIPTEKGAVVDSNIQQLHQKSDSLGKAGLAPRAVFEAQGLGRWRLSKYSPALDAAPDESIYLDANGTRGDLGPWGGTNRYAKKL